MLGTDAELTLDSDGNWLLDLRNRSTALPDGSYDVIATATDGSGNIGVDNSTLELFVDSVPPVVTVDDELTAATRPVLTGTLSEAPAEFSVRVDAETYVLGSSSGN